MDSYGAGEPTIALLALACQNRFTLLLDVLRKEDDSTAHALLRDELGRFRTWAMNIGAIARGAGCLDERLKSAKHLSYSVTGLLESLSAFLSDGLTIRNLS
jgi:hypothetical protein